MKTLVFYYDVLSPYAWLAFQQLPLFLEGLHHEVHYKPVFLAPILRHWGQRGPAEIAPKREWAWRHVQWLSTSLGLPLDLPHSHPFNPLTLLRLGLACSGGRSATNRHTTETLFRHVWQGGHDALDPERLKTLQQQLQPRLDPAGEEVKALLQSNTQTAIHAGVFGVPTVVMDGMLFWGLESLPMLRQAMENDSRILAVENHSTDKK